MANYYNPGIFDTYLNIYHCMFTIVIINLIDFHIAIMILIDINFNLYILIIYYTVELIWFVFLEIYSMMYIMDMIFLYFL